MDTRKWVLSSRPDSIHIADHLSLENTSIDVPGDGELLVEPIYLRAAPPMLKQMISGSLDGPPLPLGTTVTGSGIGRVSQSTHPGFKEGDLVSGAMPWQETFVSGGMLEKVEPINNVPASAYLHVLGAPGLTAYFGITDYAKPKPGDTLVVSTAAGAVGAVVCQLGKLQGCRVIGITSSTDKCRYLTDTLGLDGTIAYQEEDVAAQLKTLCPDGIDIYFDNVGGDTLDACLDIIAEGARVVLCGASSQYTKQGDWSGPKNYFKLVYRQAEMYGYYVYNFRNRFAEGRSRLAKLLDDGRLSFEEDIVDGFDNAPGAFNKVLASENLGTQLVKI